MERFKEVGATVRNWGRWGEHDQLGTLNFLSPAQVLAAARLVRDGRIFDLSVPIGPSGPPQRAGSPRFNPIHAMLRVPGEPWPGGMVGADDMIILPLQASTQWDGLGHNGYDGLLYNGVPATTVDSRGSAVLSVHSLAAKGVVGRGVLLDIAGLRGVASMAAGEVITANDLDSAVARQGVALQSGDVLLIHTGWMRHWTVNRDAETFWSGQPGLGLDCAQWLWRHEIAAVIADNTGVEAIPTDPGHGTDWPLHCVLIRDMGMTLGEMAVLDELTGDCRADGCWEFFFVATPLKVEGAVGSPITPLAIK